MINCFEIKIGLIAFFAAMTVGMVWNIAYGEEWNTTKVVEDSKTGTLMKHKGELYCYDETTTTKKEVKEAIKHDWMTGPTEVVNRMLTDLAEDNTVDGWEMAVIGCQNMVAQGSITNDDYNDYIEATLTMEFDWDD
jgi:hypothetical protein